MKKSQAEDKITKQDIKEIKELVPAADRLIKAGKLTEKELLEIKKMNPADAMLIGLTLDQVLAVSKTIDDPSTVKTVFEFDEKSKSTPSQDFYLYTYNIDEVTNEGYVGKPIKLLAFIYSISAPYPIDFMERGRVRRQTTYDILLKDVNGTELDCLTISQKFYKENIQKYLNTNILHLFEGTIISKVSRFGSGYYFYLKNINAKINSVDLIRVRPEKKDHANKIFNNATRTKGGVRKYIKDRLIKNIGIKGLGKAKELSKAIDFMILQSFSRGLSLDGRYSNKLHSLVIGSPAVGKKMLTLIAKILNPVAFELTSSSAKITPAGLIGNVIKSNGRTISNPGYFPMASGGIVCIQDFHEISKKDSQIFGILSKVMEDGQVIDSTSARTTHIALTSIHLDMNRLSQVIPDKQYSTYSDLNIPINVISRFDFIIDIPPDVSTQFEVILKMAEGEKELGTSDYRGETPQWKRDLQVIVAHLSDKIQTVHIDKSTSDYIVKKLKELLSKNSKYADLQKYFAGMLTRIQVSIEKYAKAIACTRISTKVSTKDIDEALDFISYKLDFLSKIDVIEVPEYKSKSEKEKRQSDIISLFNGKSLSTQDIMDELNKINKKIISKRTIERDLKELEVNKLVEKVSHGVWSK